MDRFPKCIRVDSRFRLRGSASTTDFSIELPETVEFPDDCRCFVSAVSFPVSFWNVDADVSDRLYVIETHTVGGVQQRRCRAIQIPAANYTSLSLPAALATALNAGTSLAGLSYQVDYLPSRGTLRFQLVVPAGGTPDASARFRIPSEDELTNSEWRAAHWTGSADGYDTSAPDAMSDLLRLPLTSADTTILETGILNVAPHDCLYLHSNLADFSTIAADGARDVIQRIPLFANYGFTNHFQASGDNEEYFEVSGAYRFLRFRLSTVRNRVIDLHGGHLSLELVFFQKSLA